LITKNEVDSVFQTEQKRNPPKLVFALLHFTRAF
jgi:hypothetical protein